MTSPENEITIGLRMIGAEAAVADTNRVVAATTQLTDAGKLVNESIAKNRERIDKQVAATQQAMEQEVAQSAARAQQVARQLTQSTANTQQQMTTTQAQGQQTQLRGWKRFVSDFMREMQRSSDAATSSGQPWGSGFWSGMLQSFHQGQAQATQQITQGAHQASQQAATAAGSAGQSGGSKFWDKFKSGFAGGIGALAGIAGIGGLVDLFSSSIAAYAESQDGEAKFLDAFERFPKLADTNIEKINALAAARAKLTRYDADATKGAFAQLAALRLTGAQITKLLPLVQDYAAATGKSMEQAAKDVADGFMGNSTALSEKQIGFTATGSSSVDYANMTAALQAQVGGFAEKDGQTAGATLARLKSQFTDILAVIGEALFPMVKSFADWLQNGGADVISDLIRKISELLEKVVEFVSFVSDWDGSDSLTARATDSWFPEGMNPNRKGLANGGVLSGYAPGVDSIDAKLSAGEGVLVPEVVRAIGPDAVHKANAWGVRQRFAFGGIAGSDAGYMKSALEQAMQASSWQSVFQAGGAAAPGPKNPSASPSGAAATAPPSGDPVERWRALATQALQMTGQYTPENLDAMMKRIGWESTGDPNAINNWDRNAKNGTPSQGLLQVIPPTFKAYAEPGYDKNILDPLSNMLASINYATSTYGDLQSAYLRMKNGKPAGYDSGGWLPPGGTAVSGLDKPEAILNPDQWAAMKAMADRGMESQGSGSLVIEAGAVQITVMGGDEDRILALMEAELDPMVERLARKHNTRKLS